MFVCKMTRYPSLGRPWAYYKLLKIGTCQVIDFPPIRDPTKTIFISGLIRAATVFGHLTWADRFGYNFENFGKRLKKHILSGSFVGLNKDVNSVRSIERSELQSSCLAR